MLEKLVHSGIIPSIISVSRDTYMKPLMHADNIVILQNNEEDLQR